MAPRVLILMFSSLSCLHICCFKESTQRRNCAPLSHGEQTVISSRQCCQTSMRPSNSQNPGVSTPAQADRRALNITLNSIGTELTRDDRKKLYSNFGLLYPHGQVGLLRLRRHHTFTFSIRNINTRYLLCRPVSRCSGSDCCILLLPTRQCLPAWAST